MSKVLKFGLTFLTGWVVGIVGGYLILEQVTRERVLRHFDRVMADMHYVNAQLLGDLVVEADKSGSEETVRLMCSLLSKEVRDLESAPPSSIRSEDIESLVMRDKQLLSSSPSCAEIVK